jgi:putative FmdB family regulatory protein
MMATATDLMVHRSAYKWATILGWKLGQQGWRRCSMPMYDYKCLDCGKESLVVLTLKEHEAGIAKCPACNSTNTKQLYTSFIAHTTKKS